QEHGKQNDGHQKRRFNRRLAALAAMPRHPDMTNPDPLGAQMARSPSTACMRSSPVLPFGIRTASHRAPPLAAYA
ncbi:MAG TPA: hypothetical protein K8U77_05890, partial [Slackia equolifaciens]|nr:hypothetical protein [Slackia equolifaciens]